MKAYQLNIPDKAAISCGNFRALEKSGDIICGGKFDEKPNDSSPDTNAAFAFPDIFLRLIIAIQNGLERSNVHYDNY